MRAVAPVILFAEKPSKTEVATGTFNRRYGVPERAKLDGLSSTLASFSCTVRAFSKYKLVGCNMLPEHLEGPCRNNFLFIST